MREYKCKCHICGVEHTVKADFLFGGASSIGSDGKDRVHVSCGNHTAQEVRDAYLAATK